MKGFNRKPKDIKRLARGYSNFKFVRYGILEVEREDTHILESSKPIREIKQGI